ncbi:MAG: nitrogen fixation protein NifM [Sulfurisoma sp.]|nr:nitrogen fixation protein NifM [Sulfurisoma sp.]
MRQTQPDPSPYLTLKLAGELYGKSPETLEPAERGRVAAVARRQTEIEQRILATVEASSVVLPESSIKHSLAEIRGRYAGDDEYHADLARAGLSHDTLRAAIERDLTVEAVLEQVAGRATPVSATDVEIFYLQHAAKFHKPETRTLRHILLTINDALPGNERAAAQARITAIHARLLKAPERFAEQALKHSECPTAMNGGLLGQMPRGKLFPEIDAVTFALPVGGMSAIVESPMGFHVVLCESIEPERYVSLAEASERIRARLDDGRRMALQKAWVAGLFVGA